MFQSKEFFFSHCQQNTEARFEKNRAMTDQTSFGRGDLGGLVVFKGVCGILDDSIAYEGHAPTPGTQPDRTTRMSPTASGNGRNKGGMTPTLAKGGLGGLVGCRVLGVDWCA